MSKKLDLIVFLSLVFKNVRDVVALLGRLVDLEGNLEGIKPMVRNDFFLEINFFNIQLISNFCRSCLLCYDLLRISLL